MKKDNYKSILNSIGLFDNINYNKLSVKNSDKYKKAKPFPNIQFENFLSKDIANNLNKDCLLISNGVHRSEFNNDDELNALLKKYEVRANYFQKELEW